MNENSELDLQIQSYKNLLDYLTKVHTKNNSLNNNDILLQMGLSEQMFKFKQEFVKKLEKISNEYGQIVGFTHAKIKQPQEKYKNCCFKSKRKSPSPIFTIDL
tara:strand:+ start:147 stop:455 length:309 start_codon:yes stop_codon:yes gene_type:complete